MKRGDPMDKDGEWKLDRNRDKLESCLTPTDIFSVLIELDVIDDDDVEKIKVSPITSSQVSELLKIIKMRGHDAYDKFIEALRRKNYYHLVRTLEAKPKDKPPKTDMGALETNHGDVVEDEECEYAVSPKVFLSYQWDNQDKVKLLKKHLEEAGYTCWMDIGQMGGGDKLFEEIDKGIRGAKAVICCVTDKYAKSDNCNREVNLSNSLRKLMIPLLLEKSKWPPEGSMGPIFSEYLYIRFYQRGGEETDDDRYWPVPKFQELLKQLKCRILPDESTVDPSYIPESDSRSSSAAAANISQNQNSEDEQGVGTKKTVMHQD